MKKRTVLLVLAAGLLAASCIFNPENASEQTSDALSKADVLALMSRETNHENAVETLENQVSRFLETNQSARSVGGSVTTVAGVQKITKTYENGFAVGAPGSRSLTEMTASEVPFYLFSLENPDNETEGFALASGDKRVGDILAVVEQGDYNSDDPFMELFREKVDESVRQTIEVYNSITEADVAKAEEKQAQITERALASTDPPPYGSYTTYDYDTNFAPLVSSQILWGQGAPYNKAINSVNQFTTPQKTGPQVTAIAQLMAYHESPSAPSLDILNPKATGVPDKKLTQWIDYGSPDITRVLANMTFNYGLIKIFPEAQHINNREVQAQIATLILHAAGVIQRSVYGGGSPVTDTADDENEEWITHSKIKSHLFQHGDYLADNPELVRYNPYFDENYIDNGQRNTFYKAIVPSIEAMRPVYMCADNGSSTSLKKTAWLVDDYCIRTAATTKLVKMGYVHCVPGTGKLNIGWYFVDVFSTNTGPIYGTMPDYATDPESGNSNGDYYSTNVYCITNIRPGI